MNILHVQAGGGYTSDGNDLTYRINLMEIVDGTMHVYGYAYENNDAFDYTTKGVSSNMHNYELIVNGVTYQDKLDYYIDHTELNRALNDTYSYYQDVGFHFEVAMSDITSTTDEEYHLTLQILHQNRSYATIDISYMAPLSSINNDGYTIEFSTTQINTMLYTDQTRLFVREEPSKTGAIATNEDGADLYYTPGDIYSVANGTMTGETYYDVDNKVYWYEIKYKEEGYSDSRYRVVASASGTTGWICDTFLKYYGDPLTINVSRDSYYIQYSATGGSGAPSFQKKWYGIDETISLIEPTKVGYLFDSWNTNYYGTGTKYLPGSTYSANSNAYLYAMWKNTSPVITGPIMDEEYVTTSQIAPFLDDIYFVVQLGDEINITDFFEAYDNEDGDITNKITLSSFDSQNEFMSAGIYNAILSVQDLGMSKTYYYLKILVNQEPEIESMERWFLSSWDVTIEDVLEKIKAYDKEDGDISDSIIVTKVIYDDGTVVENPTTINTVLEDGATKTIEVVYQVCDSYQKVVEQTDTIYIYQDSSEIKQTSFIRFISEDYIDSLEEESIWQNKEYFDLLEETLEESSYKTYYYNSQSVQDIKEWVLQTAPSSNTNQYFVENFMGE